MARGYIVIQVLEITDRERYAQYRREVAGLIAAAGGRFMVSRDSPRRSLEGDWDPEIFVIIEFPSLQAAEGWYYSEAYQAGLQHRLSGAISKALIVEEDA